MRILKEIRPECDDLVGLQRFVDECIKQLKLLNITNARISKKELKEKGKIRKDEIHLAVDDIQRIYWKSSGKWLTH